MLSFVLVFPPAKSHEITSREIEIQPKDDDDVTVLNYNTSRNQTDELQGDEGDTVSGKLIEVDKAGNTGEVIDFEFVLAQRMPPVAPGKVELKIASQSDAAENTPPPIDS